MCFFLFRWYKQLSPALCHKYWRPNKAADKICLFLLLFFGQMWLLLSMDIFLLFSFIKYFSLLFFCHSTFWIFECIFRLQNLVSCFSIATIVQTAESSYFVLQTSFLGIWANFELQEFNIQNSFRFFSWVCMENCIFKANKDVGRRWFALTCELCEIMWNKCIIYEMIRKSQNSIWFCQVTEWLFSTFRKVAENDAIFPFLCCHKKFGI